MNSHSSRAQAGMEYLMTYGWALALVATIFGALVFVFSPPAEQVFSSSDPTKILFKGGSIAGNIAQIKLQNITGSDLDLLSLSWDECTINNAAPVYPLLVPAGSEILIVCNNVTSAELAAGLHLDYKNFAGLLKSASISISGSQETTSPPEEPYDPGDGSLANPRKITNVAELQAIKDHLDWHYILTGNIDASETSTWNGGQGFVSISDPVGNSFTGSLDGQGYAISGLYMNSYPATGLIFSSSGEIKNLGLTGANITSTGGGTNAAILAGRNFGTISDCFSTGSVSSNGPYVAGLVGMNIGTISNSYSTASVTGVIDPTNWLSGYWVGGLVGQNIGTVANSYARGAVSGKESVGGLVGSGGTITNSYSTGSVSATTASVGGLVGLGGTCTNSFWDTQTSGKATSACGASGKTTALMQTQSTFAGWDFATVWQMSGYPALR